MTTYRTFISVSKNNKINLSFEIEQLTIVPDYENILEIFFDEEKYNEMLSNTLVYNINSYYFEKGMPSSIYDPSYDLKQIS